MISLVAAVVWVDFFTILLSKFQSLGKSLDKWYAKFGMTAVLSDCLVILLGIMIAKLLFPNGSVLVILIASIVIQLIHDILFYVAVIKPIPVGTNEMIDLFKEYSAENSWKILVADSLMIGSTVVLAELIDSFDNSLFKMFKTLLGVYALTYVIYTKPYY